MNNIGRKRIINKICKAFSISPDEFDFASWIDTSLSDQENISAITGELNSRGFGSIDVREEYVQHDWKAKERLKDSFELLWDKSNRPMKSLQSDVVTKKICGFDIETCEIDDVQEFVMASVVSYDINRTFWDKKKLINFLSSRAMSGYYIFATNLSFDFWGTYFSEIDSVNCKPIYSGKLIGVENICEVEQPSGKVRKNMFLDTMNFYPASVETLGEVVDLPKLEKPDFLGEKTKREMSFQETKYLMIYNYRDSEVSYEFMYWLQNQINQLGGSLEMTISKTALDLFRRKYFDDIWFSPNPERNIFIREGYYGGRTEVFKRGRCSNLNCYDVNSLYPSVMVRELPDPNSYEKVDKPSISNIFKFHGFSRCVVKTPAGFDCVPYLPVRHDDKLVFPIGEFSGVWTHFELRRARELGYIIEEVQEQCIFKKMKTYFRDYVLDLYKKRKKWKKEGKDEQLILKLLLNSLYGKFGQTDVQKTYYHVNDTKTENIELETIKDFIRLPDTHEEIFYVTETGFTRPFVHPEICAYITAYARDVLYDYLQKYDVYYCDTDSIFTPETLESSKELGEMELEKEISDALFVKPKFYYYIEKDGKRKNKLKGASGINSKDFDAILDGKEYARKKLSKFKESMTRGFMPLQTIDATKNMSLEDEKRKWKKKFNKKELQNSYPISFSFLEKKKKL
ncbi:MAG: DNA polymerase [Candidatus Aenigmatarchaeota archaeon]